MSHLDNPSEPGANRPVPTVDMEREALVWLQLLTSGEPRAWDVDGFWRWVQLDPAHRAAFNEVKRRRDRMPQPDAAMRASLLAGVRRPAQVGRRAWLGAAASAAGVAAVAVVHPPLGLWSALSVWDADERTAAGEQRTFLASSSASVTLNTRTSVRREVVDGDTVGLHLVAGEAAIDLAGTRRPFGVTAGAGRSIAAAGRFEVRFLGDKVCVSCMDGEVRVVHPAGNRTLLARQQVRYDAAALSGTAPIDPRQVSAWRSGELLFDQASLADVIEEINRYRTGKVVLAKASARSQSVNGRFAIASLDLALSQLQHAFGLNARHLPGNLLILS